MACLEASAQLLAATPRDRCLRAAVYKTAICEDRKRATRIGLCGCVVGTPYLWTYGDSPAWTPSTDRSCAILVRSGRPSRSFWGPRHANRCQGEVLESDDHRQLPGERREGHDPAVRRREPASADDHRRRHRARPGSPRLAIPGTASATSWSVQIAARLRTRRGCPTSGPTRPSPSTLGQRASRHGRQ